MEIKNYIDDVSFLEPIYNRIPIVLVCDKGNIPETMTTVLSIFEIKDNFYYDIIIIHNTLDEYDVAAFEHMLENLSDRKVGLRFDRIEHDFTKGYIRIASYYKKEYLLKCFLPIILKRYTKFIYVRSGNILKAGISQFYESFTGEPELEIIGNKILAEVVVYNASEFRMLYSVADIKNSLTRCASELDTDFFRKLSGIMPYGSPSGIVEIYDNEQPSSAFRKLIGRVPYFEKWIYERNGINKANIKPVETEFYLFPFELVSKGARVVLYGNGKVGGQYRQQVEMTQFCELVAIVDRDAGEGILAPTELADLEYDYVIIAVANDKMAGEIRNSLVDNKVKAGKIIYATKRKL